MDSSHPSLAGRVGLPLAVLLALLWSGSSAQPGMTGAPPAHPAVRAALQAQYGILGHHVHAVQPAARHDRRNRRASAPAATLAAALAGAVVATTRRERVSRSRRLDSPLLALRPRAPPSWRPRPDGAPPGRRSQAAAAPLEVSSAAERKAHLWL